MLQLVCYPALTSTTKVCRGSYTQSFIGSMCRKEFSTNSASLCTVACTANHRNTSLISVYQCPMSQQNSIFDPLLGVSWWFRDAGSAHSVHGPDILASEINNIHTLGAESSMKQLQSKLINEGMSCEKIAAIIADVKRDDVFNIALNANNGILRSQYKRLAYYKENLQYIEPQQIALGCNDSNKRCFYHYVPIKDTLTVMLSDMTVQACVGSARKSQNGVIENLCDGSLYKSISLSVNDPTFVEVILYEDAFQIVNPLGSAKLLLFTWPLEICHIMLFCSGDLHTQ